MTRLASTADRQFFDLIDYYLERGFDDAAEQLILAVEQAEAAITADPSSGRNFPAIYEAMAWPGVRWLKVHRYWFSYTTQNEPIIFNILWDAADIPNRATPPADSCGTPRPS